MEIVICILVGFFLLGVATGFSYDMGRRNEKERFEKEAIYMGFGTYEPDDNSALMSGNEQYVFEWKDITIREPFQSEIGV